MFNFELYSKNIGEDLLRVVLMEVIIKDFKLNEIIITISGQRF